MNQIASHKDTFFAMELYRLLMNVYLLSLFQTSRAREYFISTDGNDSNSGTFEKPWKYVQYTNMYVYYRSQI